VSLETGDPEEQSADLQDGVIALEVRLTRNCAECGEEKKESTVSQEEEITDKIDAHMQKFHADVPDAERPTLSLSVEYSTEEGGGGRYKKNMIELISNYTVTCDTCTGDDELVAEGSITDSCAAGEFEEM